MTKKININCSFGGQVSSFPIYVGSPEGDHHPIHFQSDWLSKERGGTVPEAVMKSLSDLQKISRENNIPLEDLCEYALESSKIENEAKKNVESSDDDGGSDVEIIID